MKIIGVDGNEANVSLRVGVSNYTYQLLHYFKKKANEKVRFIIFLREKPKKDLPKSNQYFQYQVVWGKFLWSQIFLPLKLTREKLDVFFSPAHYLPRFISIPSVVTIHDLSFYRYPEDFRKIDLIKLLNGTSYSIKKASQIIAVSQATKNDILKIYRLPQEKVTVIYNGFEKPKLRWGKTLKKVPKKYFLYVGTLQPRKNIITLIHAFNEIQKRNKNFELVIAGKKGWMYQSLFQEVLNLGLSRKVFFTDYITDKQLIFLYRHAYVFIMPSLYEGFGIPVLEAMSYGCPVISSYTSSLPEVGGDACLYFNPLDTKSLITKMEQLIHDIKLRTELIKKGKERIKLFSWEKCAEETLNLLLNVAQK